MGTVNKPSIKVKVDIQSVPASLAQKAAWRRFWEKVFAEASHDSLQDNANDNMKKDKLEKTE